MEGMMVGFVMVVIGKWSKVVVFALEPAFYYLYSKNPYIRADVLRTISLKFHNSFRVKLFVYRFFERTLSMAETNLLLV